MLRSQERAWGTLETNGAPEDAISFQQSRPYLTARPGEGAQEFLQVLVMRVSHLFFFFLHPSYMRVFINVHVCGGQRATSGAIPFSVF